jgi:hypothetical protein
MKVRWRYLTVTLLMLLALLLVVLLSASSWLETSAGRKLLQRELRKSLSLEAQLQGEYSLNLFPTIQIVGNELILSDINSGNRLAVVHAYELRLALMPLLRKKIDIIKISIRDSRLDLDQLLKNSSAEPQEASKGLPLPKIRELEITGLKLQKSTEDVLQIAQMNLSDFAENKSAAITLALALPQAAGEALKLQMAGHLQVSASPLEVQLELQDLSLQSAGPEWRIGAGKLSWSANKAELIGDLNGQLGPYKSHYGFSARFAEAMQFTLNAELQSADSARLAARLVAESVSGGWVLAPVALDLDGQILEGAGCFSMLIEPLLQMQLDAQVLNLDALQALLPEQLMPANPASEAGILQPDNPGLTGLPVELNVRLTVQQLNWSGAIARVVKLQLGAEPDCSLKIGAVQD